MGYSRTLTDLKGRRLLRSCATEPFVDPESLALHARWGVVCERLSKMWALLNDGTTAAQFAGEHMTTFSLETVKLLEGEAAALESTHDIFEDMMRTVESRKRLVQRLTLLGSRVCTANITACSNELKLLVGLIRAKSLALFEATRELQKQPVQSFRFSTHTMLACIGDDVADAVADSSIKDLFGFSLTANPFLHPECGAVQPGNEKSRALLAVALSKADREQLAHVVEWMGAPTPYGHYFANNRASRAMYAAVVALVAGATHHTEAPRRRSVVRVAPPKSASRTGTEAALCAAALCIAVHGTQRPLSMATDRAFMGKRSSLESLPGTPPVHLPQPRLSESDLRTFAMYEQADRLPDRRHSLSESLASNSPGRPMPATVSSVQDTPLSYPAPHSRKESIATSGFGDSGRAPSPCGGSMSSVTSVHVRTKGGKPPMPTREPSIDKDINKRDRYAEKDKDKDKDKEKEAPRKVEWAPVKDGGFVDLFSQNKTQVARMMVSRPRTAPTMPARDDAASPPPPNPEGSGTESRNNSEADLAPSRTPPSQALAGTPYQQPLPVPGPARSPPPTPPLAAVSPVPKAEVVAPKVVTVKEPAPEPDTPPTHDPLNALVAGIRGDPSDPEKANRVLRALATCRGEESPVSALCQAMASEDECSLRVHTALTLLTSCSE